MSINTSMMQHSGLEDLSHVQSRPGQSFKISCSSGNGFWLDHEDLSSDFPPNRDMACKLGCGLFLSPQKQPSPTLNIIPYACMLESVREKYIVYLIWYFMPFVRHHSFKTPGQTFLNVKFFHHNTLYINRNFWRKKKKLPKIGLL